MMSPYYNPIRIDGDFADPFVLRFNGTYYLYCTDPTVRVRTSTDLLNWRNEGSSLDPQEVNGLVPFAPEVIYSNGWFYMYTSPSGFGHVVLRSTSPLGPFVRVTENLGREIDGSVLIDDDGQWYFYWAGWDGIHASRMSSPTCTEDESLTGASLHGWTEGPTVIKRDGYYYMTYTGNHFLSPGYRVNVAVSQEPLRGFVDLPDNPQLLRTSGEYVGLGHPSIVQGPDLVSTYVSYHSIRADKSRQLNLDRIVWVGDAVRILGPARCAPGPAAPRYEFRWRSDEEIPWRDSAGRVVSSHEGWGIPPVGRVTLHGRVIAAESTTELTLVGSEEHPWSIALESGMETAWRATFSPGTQTVSVGEDTCILPVDFAHAHPHTIRIETHRGGVRASIDSLTLPVAPALAVPAHLWIEGADRIGYFAYTGSTREVADAIAPCPVPGPLLPRFGDQTVVSGKDIKGTLVVSSARLGATEITITQTESKQRHQLCDPHMFTCPITVPKGASRLVVHGDSEAEGPIQLSIESELANCGASVDDVEMVGTRKSLYVAGPYVHLTAETDIWVDWASRDGHGDLLVRASEFAKGYEGDDERLGADFFLGYSIQLHHDRIVVARHRYDETSLAETTMNLKGDHKLLVTCRGSRLTVQLDGSEVVDVVDPVPIALGGVGTRVVDAHLHVRGLTVSPAAEL